MTARTRNRFELGALARPASALPKAKLHIMSMFKKLISAFELPPAPPASTEAENLRLARATVAEHSHGNVHLQSGDYYTKDDLDIEVAEVKSFDFARAIHGRSK